MKTYAPSGEANDTGPLGPVAISALLFLIALAPLMRGGNRQVALIPLEAAALAMLAALAARLALWPRWRMVSLRGCLLAFVLSSPLWLALVYLVPVPAELWSAAAGRAEYHGMMSRAGIAPPPWLPLSLVPDATVVSLLAGIPLIAAFLGGFLARVSQLRMVLSVLVVLAFIEVVFGLLQMAGGQASALYFGGYGGRPFGTFANANHYANYIAMALAAYVWLGWNKVQRSQQQRDAAWAQGPLERHAMVLWLAGGIVLMLGVLMSRSRGAALGGLPAGLLALTITMAVGSRSPRLRTIVLVVAGLLLAALALVGVDMIMNRFRLSTFTSDASIRSMLAAATMEGASHFWPWGAGWGTYAAVFPRFQPASLVGYADFAHNDYAQMLFEGGAIAVLLMAAFAWLAIGRAVFLLRVAMRERRLRRQELASAVCGLGLLGFLLHSLVEFNMHIPANAITAALLAGAYLRPLRLNEEQTDD